MLRSNKPLFYHFNTNHIKKTKYNKYIVTLATIEGPKIGSEVIP